MTQRTPKILELAEIRNCLTEVDLLSIIETGFVALSTGEAIVPPVGELLFENPPGDVHIKYGYIRHQPYYVIKIASGFYNNPKLGIKSSQGLMLAFSQQTGELAGVLLDDGYLTDVRTTIASMITIKHLAPRTINSVGIVGTGTQAQMQLDYLHQVCDCKSILVWGRSSDHANAYKSRFTNSSYNIEIITDLDELAARSQVIITTTPSQAPLLSWKQIKAGTHITAIGSDTSEKIELSETIMQNADVIVSDSINQSQTRGEIYRARKENMLDESKLIELGNLIKDPALGRQNDHQITVADLTGVAVQDIMIASAVLSNSNLI